MLILPSVNVSIPIFYDSILLWVTFQCFLLKRSAYEGLKPFWNRKSQVARKFKKMRKDIQDNGTS